MGTIQLLLDLGLVDEVKSIVETWMGRWIKLWAAMSGIVYTLHENILANAYDNDQQDCSRIGIIPRFFHTYSRAEVDVME